MTTNSCPYMPLVHAFSSFKDGQSSLIFCTTSSFFCHSLVRSSLDDRFYCSSSLDCRGCGCGSGSVFPIATHRQMNYVQKIILHMVLDKKQKIQFKHFGPIKKCIKLVI